MGAVGVQSLLALLLIDQDLRRWAIGTWPDGTRQPKREMSAGVGTPEADALRIECIKSGVGAQPANAGFHVFDGGGKGGVGAEAVIDGHHLQGLRGYGAPSHQIRARRSSDGRLKRYTWLLDLFTIRFHVGI